MSVACFGWWFAPGRAVADGGEFPSSGVTLLGRVALSEFPGMQARGNDIWGYVSPSGREYAIMGVSDGTGFIEVTDPTRPTMVGYVAGPHSIWRDMKVHQEVCYTVSQEGDGLQIIDLSEIDSGVVTHVSTSNLNGLFFVAHNIALNAESGYAYPVLSDINPGITAVDLADPFNPVIAGMWTEVGVHDVQVVSYPDGLYAGREIAFAFCQGDGVYIVDVTDKSNMFTLSSVQYPGVSYSHQGWLSTDRRYLFAGDELDELFAVTPTTKTLVFDVLDIEQPVQLASFSSGLPATDHNMMVRGDFLFEANYTSGMRIFDVSDVGQAAEVGFFDTFPEHNEASWGFEGAWGVYPDLPSGVVIVADRERGLFVLDTSEITGSEPIAGDWDGDGDVDLFDYTAFLGCVGEPGAPAGVECAVFDLDADGDVDREDFGILQIGFTG